MVTTGCAPSTCARLMREPVTLTASSVEVARVASGSVCWAMSGGAHAAVTARETEIDKARR
ncbi:hypothetical protein [Xanthomonas citri]|uniref:hypothetical protein n=1 Tax=Xanthomonas citri TaxID=346 RepID=UPI001F272BE5|nr:hypothetical protein [Xanthomonas citri]